MKSLEIHNIGSYIAVCEANGLAKVFQAYADNTPTEDIMEVGFNPNSGYVYIALENGVQIASAFGRDVEFIVVDFETGEEHFLSSYDEAMEIMV